MSWLSNPKKAIKRHFSFSSWKKGKGLIGLYNPIKRLHLDARKLYRGLRHGSAGGNVAKILTGTKRYLPVYQSAAPTSARTLADIS